MPPVLDDRAPPAKPPMNLETRIVPVLGARANGNLKYEETKSRDHVDGLTIEVFRQGSEKNRSHGKAQDIE